MDSISTLTLEKRDQFAVSLRKQKKDQWVSEKIQRRKHLNDELNSEYTGECFKAGEKQDIKPNFGDADNSIEKALSMQPIS